MKKRQLTSLTNVNSEENNNEVSTSELIRRERIENIFTAVQFEDRKWFIALGQYRLTESRFDTLEAARSFIQKQGINWGFLLSVLAAAITAEKSLTNNSEKL